MAEASVISALRRVVTKPGRDCWRLGRCAHLSLREEVPAMLLGVSQTRRGDMCVCVTAIYPTQTAAVLLRVGERMCFLLYSTLCTQRESIIYGMS